MNMDRFTNITDNINKMIENVKTNEDTIHAYNWLIFYIITVLKVDKKTIDFETINERIFKND